MEYNKIYLKGLRINIFRKMWMFYTDNPCTVSKYMNMIFEIYNLYRMHIKMKNAVKLLDMKLF